MSTTYTLSSEDEAHTVQPYQSLIALRSAEKRLRQKENEVIPFAAFVSHVKTFVCRGQATGQYLYLLTERREAQALLDYWFDVWREASFNEGKMLSFDSTLAPFDPLVALGLDVSQCPYVGLKTFRREDSRIFFGRNQLINYLVHRLEEDREKQDRFLALVGPSGSGKSSLVLAGLIPALADGAISAEGDVPSSSDWYVYPVLVPGSNPLANLNHILRTATPPQGVGKVPAEQTFLEDQTCLVNAIDRQCLRPAVLVIDQFEEVFTLCTEPALRHAFLNNLATVMSSQFRHTVLLTMRIDFESYIVSLPKECSVFNALYDEGRIHVPPLSTVELREAIMQPAQFVGLKFETGVVDALIRDALSEHSSLPLVQFSLSKLWENRQVEENLIPKAAYEALGGIQKALEKSADKFFATLSDHEQKLARTVLLKMIKHSENLEYPDFTSCRIRRNEIRQIEGADAVLQKLIDASLVRLTEGETPVDDQVELVHETLTKKWPLFVGWLDEKQARLKLLIRLKHDAEEWKSTAKGDAKNDLFVRGARLIVAEEMVSQGEVDEPLVLDFVAASVAYREQKEAEREVQRLAKLELKYAQKLAEQAQQLADERGHRNMILSRSVFALACAATLAIASIIVAIGFWRTSEGFRRITTLTLAKNWVAEADVQSAPQVRLLLAAEAAYQVGQFDQEWYQEAGSALPEQPDTPSDTTLQQDAQTQTARSLRFILEQTGGIPLRTEYGVIMSASRAIATSANGRWLAVGNVDGTVNIWDTSRQYDTLVQTPIHFYAEITSLAFSPDNHWLVATSTNIVPQRLSVVQTMAPDLLVLDMTAADLSRASVITITQPSPIAGMAFAPNTSRPALYVLNQDGGVRRYSDFSEQAEPEIIVPANGHFLDASQFSVSPDGKWMAAIAPKTNSLILWEVEADDNAVIRQLAGNYATLAFSPDGQWLAAPQTGSTRVSLFHLEDLMQGDQEDLTPIELAPPQRRSDDLPLGEITIITFAPDSRRIAAGYVNGAVGIWSIGQPQITSQPPTVTLYDHKQSVTALAFKPVGDELATSSADQFLRIWSLTGQADKPVFDKLASATPVNQIMWIGDDRLITQSEEGLIQYWDTSESPAIDEMSMREAVELACRRTGRALLVEEKQHYYVPEGATTACEALYTPGTQ